MRLLIIALLLAGSVFAADVDGKWAGRMSTPNGDMPVAFTFKADGAKLTGTTAGLDGADVKIADGKVDGNKISFTVTFDFGGMDIVLSYKGVVTKDEIKFDIEVMGMPLDVTVKRVA
jgi:hypothetical protein